MTRAEAEAPSRLVVRLPNWLGDAVLSLPALRVVRQTFPESFLALAVSPSIAPVFEEESGVRPQQILTVTTPTEAAVLRDGAFDTALLLTNSFRGAWVAKRSGIPNRWGYAAGVRGPLLTKSVRRPRAVHQSVYYLHLVEELITPWRSDGMMGTGPNLTSAAPIQVTEGTRLRARKLLDGLGVSQAITLVGFAPGAAYGHAKRWPPDRVARVVTRLARERGIRSVLVGAAGDREAGRAIESTLPPDVSVVNLIGRTDLRLLMGVIRQCAAFVSNDSGALHLAAALGVSVTAIFGPTNERATAPLGDHDVLLHQVFCRPCMLRECPIDHRCMKRIGDEDVYDAVTRRMDRHA